MIFRFVVCCYLRPAFVPTFAVLFFAPYLYRMFFRFFPTFAKKGSVFVLLQWYEVGKTLIKADLFSVQVWFFWLIFAAESGASYSPLQNKKV